MNNQTNIYIQRINAVSVINKFFEEQFFKELKTNIMIRLFNDLKTIKFDDLNIYFCSAISYINDDTKFKEENKNSIKRQLIILFNNNPNLQFTNNEIDNIVVLMMNKYYDNFKKEILDIYEIGYQKTLKL